MRSIPESAVDQVRIQERLESLARFSSTTTGVTRTSWSSEYFQARNWLARECESAGLATSVDQYGNLWASWSLNSGKGVVVGSHIDTVPRGGMYDGCLGLIGGLEAVTALKNSGFVPTKDIHLVAWIEEEGTATGRTMLGSGLYTGDVYSSEVGLAGGKTSLSTLLREDIDRRDDAGIPSLMDLECYLELHVEQGPVLDLRDISIGVVSSITGYRAADITFSGEANHAGTTPMELRRDALLAAGNLIVTVKQIAVEAGVFATIGQVTAEPGARNVIAGVTRLTIDVRSESTESLAQFAAQIQKEVRLVGNSCNCEGNIEWIGACDPAPMNIGLQATIESASSDLGLSHVSLPSGALHDAAQFANKVPTGMIFVPSIAGISHSPKEMTAPSDCRNGALVLTKALQAIAG